MKRLLYILLCCMLAIASSLQAQTIPDDATGRLWRLGKVWGYLKYYSPGTCHVRWDSLLNATVPLIQNAASNTEFNNRMMDMLHNVGQIPAAQATLPPAADSNFNLQLAWTDDPVFSADVRSFLDTFEMRAGRNDSLPCRITQNSYSDPAYKSYIDFRGDKVDLPVVRYNNTGHRFTVLFHYWNIFNYFAPYRNLADENWDSVLLQAIPETIAAVEPSDFHYVMLRMHAKTGDSHNTAGSTYYGNAIGWNYAGILLSRVEDKIVVTKVRAGVQEVKVGDVLNSIGGRSVNELIATYRRYIAASNEPAFYRDACLMLTRGTGLSNRFDFTDASGVPYTTTLAYNMGPQKWYNWYLEDERPAQAVLCNGYGYINLNKLVPGQVKDVYREMKDKEGLVLDLRKIFNNGTFIELVTLFFARPVLAARYFSPDFSAPGRFYAKDDLDNLGTWNNPEPYKGKLFLLVNEETQSFSEYLTQYLSHFEGAKVVGSQTAGADGNIVYVTYPGMSFYFSGLGWYYSDWYQCQRNGIKIDRVVKPTVQGISEGKDEVLASVGGCPSTGTDTLKMVVYPNPASDQLAIVIAAGKEKVTGITIHDAIGKAHYRVMPSAMGQGQYRADLNIGHWSSGVYLVSVHTASGIRRTLKCTKR